MHENGIQDYSTQDDSIKALSHKRWQRRLKHMPIEQLYTNQTNIIALNNSTTSNYGGLLAKLTNHKSEMMIL